MRGSKEETMSTTSTDDTAKTNDDMKKDDGKERRKSSDEPKNKVVDDNYDHDDGMKLSEWNDSSLALEDMKPSLDATVTDPTTCATTTASTSADKDKDNNDVDNNNNCSNACTSNNHNNKDNEDNHEEDGDKGSDIARAEDSQLKDNVNLNSTVSTLHSTTSKIILSSSSSPQNQKDGEDDNNHKNNNNHDIHENENHDDHDDEIIKEQSSSQMTFPHNNDNNECSISITHSRNRKDSEISALSSSQHDECHTNNIILSTSNTTNPPSQPQLSTTVLKIDPQLKKVRNDSEVSSITQPPLPMPPKAAEAATPSSNINNNNNNNTNNNQYHNSTTTIRKSSDDIISSGGSKFSNLLLQNLDDSLNTTNHIYNSDVRDGNNIKMRTDSDGSFSATGSGLSALKLDLFSNSTATNADSMNNNDVNHHSHGDHGGNDINNSERKGSDVSGLTSNAMLESIGISTGMSNNKQRKESDLSTLFTYRKESDASAASTLMSIRKESNASELSSLIRDQEEEMMRQETMHATNVSEYAVGRSRSSSMRKDSFSGIGSTGGGGGVDPFENLRKLSDASTVVSLDQLHRSPAKLEDLTAVGATALIGLGDIKLNQSKDDASVATFENPTTSMRPPQEESKDESIKVKTEPSSTKSNDKMKTSALDHLDALGPGKQNSEDGSHSTATLNETNHKILVDALLMTGNNPSRRNRAESWGAMSDISHHNAAALAASTTAYEMQIPRGPSPAGMEYIMSPRSQGSYGSFSQETIPNKIAVPKRNSRERLDSCSSGSHAAKERERYYQRKRKDSIEFKFRERVESFDVGKSLAVGRERLDSFIVNRDRIDSIANLSGIFSRGRDRLDSLASLGEVSLTMSIGDLEEVAGQLEHIANKAGEDSSVPESDSSYLHPKSHPGQKIKQNQRPMSASTIQVDSEAVQAAVQAAMAATDGGVLDFLNIKTPGTKPQTTTLKFASTTPITTNPKHSNDELEAIRARARAAAGYIHPDNGGPQPAKPKPKPIKKRPPISNTSPTPSKRPKLPLQLAVFSSSDIRTPSTKAPNGPIIYSNFNSVTPKRHNLQNFPSATKSITSTPGSAMSKGGQSNQKWDEMYECLVLYVKEERAKSTKGLSEEEAEKWEWSGNVPTMFKTNDGKALGRWINNQRSAKSKGTLKREREIKLVSTGLKWSVLTTNAWTDMMRELRLYVDEQVNTSLKILHKCFINSCNNHLNSDFQLSLYR